MHFPNLMLWPKILRVHQWLKNLLIYVPFIAAHQLTDLDSWLALTMAFFSFGLCASSAYIGNDLLDLESDRQHPRKRNRPFASGKMSIWMGIPLALLLLMSGLLLAAHVNGGFFSWLLFYFTLTCAYSWKLKRLVLIDCLTLAMLYTIRLVAGAAATSTPLSFWLLTCSIFLFLSLAFLKRYTELRAQLPDRVEALDGRGYYTSDVLLIQLQGITSGYIAVLVLALYLNSTVVTQLYRFPEIIWGAVPVMLFWISWMWLQAHRDNMHDDPMIFAVKDKASLAAGLLFSVILLIGAVGLPL